MGPEFATLFDSLGWAILHSLWQGTVAALAVLVFRSFTKDSQAALRYGFQTLCLGLCLVAFLATFGLYQVQSGHAVMTPGTNLLSFTNISAVFTLPPVTPDVAGTPSATLGLYMAPYTPFVGALWVVGFTLLALKYSTAFVLTQRLRRHGLSTVPSTWQRRFSTLVLNAGIRRNVDIFTSSKVKGPLTLGFFKPIVLVPAGFFASLPADQVEAILLHEIGHIRRHDYLVNLLQTAIRTIFFFHPAIHYISRKIDHDREHACDDFAVALNRDPDALIRGLAALRMKLSPEAFALAADNGNTPLVSRLKRLGAPTETRRRPEHVMTSIVALIVASGAYVASSPFADAHPTKLTETLIPEPVEHPSARKNNYTFEQVTKNGRTFTAKIAENGTRWINVKGSWYDIDRSPEMVSQLPIIPIAPEAPILETNLDANIDAIVKASLEANLQRNIEDAILKSKLDQYNLDVDYYVASANHYETMAGGPKKDTRSLERDIKAAEKAREKALERAERIREKALAQAEQEIERQIERAQADYERAIAQAEQQRERAEEQRERAMEQAEAHREQAMEQAEREREHAERQAQMAERQREMMEAQLERAEEQRERAHERAEEQREREMERAEEQREREMERLERQRERKTNRQTRLQKDANTYKDFSDAVLVQLRTDGLIAADAKSVTITYPNKKMAVNGKLVARSVEGNYCELLDEYGIKKTARTRIKITPTQFEYSSRSNDGRSRHRVQETLADVQKQASTAKASSQISLQYGRATPISFTAPTQTGHVSSSFGDNLNNGKHHSGIDLAAPHSTTVVASAPGIVTSAQMQGRWGNRVTISHGGGYKTRYAHMEKICVEEGEKVSRGQKIGQVGSTGVSTGPHLHFEIQQDGKTHDPADVIAGLGKT